MEFKIYPSIMKVFSAFLLFFSIQIFACGWSESAETTRLALFRAERINNVKLRPFCYSADYYMSVKEGKNADQIRNCKEWQAKLGSQISIDDIYEILYNTESEKFENASKSKVLQKVFKDNSFIEALVLPKNKLFFEYISLAKKIEYNNLGGNKWESWDEIQTNYYDKTPKAKAVISNFKNKLKSTKDAFLIKRYAFLLLRYDFYNNGTSKEIEELYKKYFASKDNSILNPWAMHYFAMSIEDKALRNYYLSKVFVSCDEKAFAVMLNFDDKIIEETLKYAKNDFEKGIILALKCMRNPSPALKDLKEIQQLIPQSEYFSFLVGREINKLEDWIFTPKYTQSSPSVTFETQDWYSNYEKAKKENEIKDYAYLNELKEYLIEIQSQAVGEQKDFYNTAIAQLCFINDEIDLGKQYSDKISSNANASIQLQKHIQLALIALKQGDISNEKTKQILFESFNAIEDIVENDATLFKSMYSLYRIASKQYFDKNDATTAGLLFLKSENKKTNSDNFDGYYDYYSNQYYYYYIGYFERFAKERDIDNLIALIQKEDKTPFEKYICSGTTYQDINAYKDVKGTLAFRNNNLELAQKTFAEIPKEFYEKTYEFKSYLNENPFIPKVLVYGTKERKYDYKFNKANFVATLIKLKKQNTAESNLKLAHAYYNVSSVGNAWMMTTYGLSSGEYGYADFVFGGNRVDQEVKFQNGNFYSLEMARQYYQKALQLAKNKEIKAMASLMIFECALAKHYSFAKPYEEIPKPFIAGIEIKNFLTIYKNTKTYQQYNCPMLEQFIK